MIMSMGPIAYQILPKAEPGKWYVCEVHRASNSGPPVTTPVAYHERRLNGPLDTEDEANAASGAIEAEHPYYRARTEPWQCPIPESDSNAPMLPGFTAALADTQPLPVM
jgi:hypothetical protein